MKPCLLLIVTSYGFVADEIRKYIINGIVEYGDFLINLLSMNSSFLVKFMNRLLNQINICFFIIPDFTFMLVDRDCFHFLWTGTFAFFHSSGKTLFLWTWFENNFKGFGLHIDDPHIFTIWMLILSWPCAFSNCKFWIILKMSLLEKVDQRLFIWGKATRLGETSH